MNNKELRVKAQDYTEENGINRNTNQIEKAFIDGALMILNQAKNNESLHDVSCSRINCEYEDRGSYLWCEKHGIAYKKRD